jgi:hypothetical protein
VARLSKSGESAEVQRTVDNVASRREGVSQNVGSAAVAVDVSAIGPGSTRSGRGALRGDPAENTLEGRDGAGRGRLEVLLNLGGVGSGSRTSSSGKGGAVRESVDRGCPPAAGAVGLHGRSLHEVAADFLGRGTVDLSGEGVAGVLNSTGDLRGVDSGGGESTNRGNVESTTVAEVVQLSYIERGLNSLTRCDDLEGILGNVVSRDADLDSSESDLGA